MHDHDHGARGHNGHAASANYGRAFAIGVTLNLGFVVVEVAFGIVSGSIALIADAAHNLSDVLGLALSWVAFILARRRPSKRRTYGFRKSTVLAALANSVLLFVAVGGVAWESIGRLRSPSPTEGGVVMAVAAVGVVINGIAALTFAKGRHDDVNIKGAFLHLAGDALVSLAVVVTGFGILKTGWLWLDPIAGLIVSVVIVAGTWGLLRQSLNLALDAVPDGIDPESVKQYLAGLPGVVDVHDFHVWAMSTTETALTAHLVMPTDSCHPRFLSDVARELERRYRIQHSTLQVEVPEAPDECHLASDESV